MGLLLAEEIGRGKKTPCRTADYTGVTELPGNLAHKEQLSILMTRYHWAAQYARDREVLEAACGAGQGLGYLRRTARRVVGGDIDPNNLTYAEASYRGRTGIELQQFDAQEMPFDDGSFDLVLLFEAIYYLPHPERFFAEAHRVLRPQGQVLVSSVNCQWPGFNPSPYSVRYYTAKELAALAEEAGFGVQMWVGFPDRADSLRRRAIRALRRAAAALRLIPKTMRGKAWLKRLFYGPLQPVPPELCDGLAQPEPLTPITPSTPISLYKMLYLLGQK
ncbi:MAG TPA: class I SAM-dependent methyltransferase [Thermoguttaceae bacterium]|nr:class I SAM-dependent methyltransferase [Thermoguttaceae bacterium]